jgi:hypothetical protein
MRDAINNADRDYDEKQRHAEPASERAGPVVVAFREGNIGHEKSFERAAANDGESGFRRRNF